jgi:hypothetical protein
LRERYVEIRYEDLCRNFVPTATKLFEATGIEASEKAMESTEAALYVSSIGKHKACPRRSLERVLRIEKPLLLSLGYLERDPEPTADLLWRSHLADQLMDRWRRRSRPPRTT